MGRYLGWYAASAAVVGIVFHLASSGRGAQDPGAQDEGAQDGQAASARAPGEIATGTAAAAAAGAILEQAALRRFAATTPSIVGPDGTMRPVTDRDRATALKVLHFKQALVNEARTRNPGLAEQAEARLRRRRPARVEIGWQSPAGEEWVEKIVVDTVGCGLAGRDALFHVSIRELELLSCLYDDDPSYWESVDTSVTVSITDIQEDEVAWDRLREREMRDMAADAFVQRTLQARQQE